MTYYSERLLRNQLITISGVIREEISRDFVDNNELVTTSGDVVSRIPVVIGGDAYFTVSGTRITHNLQNSVHFTNIVPTVIETQDIIRVGIVSVARGENFDIVHNTGGPLSAGLPFMWSVSSFGEAPPQAFIPTDIDGCELWLEADQGVTTINGKVSAWEDFSGKGRDVSQTTDSQRPDFVAGIYNGNPTLRFGVSDIMGFTDLTLLRNRSSVTVFAVVTNSGTSGDVRSFITTDQGSGGQLRCGIQFDCYGFGVRRVPEDSFTFRVNDPIHVNDNILYCTSIDYTSGAGTLYVNGAEIIDPVFGSFCSEGLTPDSNHDYASVGGSPGGGFWEGDVSLIVVYSKALNNLERQSLETYYAQKYGVSVN
jgi:hypothetical protein